MYDGHPSGSVIKGDTLRRLGVLERHAQGVRGAGMAVGFADYGFDAWHPVLRTAATGQSRFHMIRSQAESRTIDPRAYRSAPAAGYDPHANFYGPSGRADPAIGAHGTHMASIAAGSAWGGFVGAAPEAALFGVHLDLPDTAWKEIRADGTPTWLDWDPAAAPVWRGWLSYADARPIADAIIALYEAAVTARCDDGTPYRGIVINLSVGTWAGPHNGRSRVCAAIDDVVSRGETGDGPPCAVVVGAGNAGQDCGHVCGRLAAAQSTDIDWVFDKLATMPDKLEIWIARTTGDPAISCTLSTAPAMGSAAGMSFDIAPGPTTDITVAGRRCGVADYTPRASGGLDRVRIALSPRHFKDTIQSNRDGHACWQVVLKSSDRAVGPATFHVWRERNDDAKRSVLRNATPVGTLCDFACAAKAWLSAASQPQPRGRIAIQRYSRMRAAAPCHGCTMGCTIGVTMAGRARRFITERHMLRHRHIVSGAHGPCRRDFRRPAARARRPPWSRARPR